MELYNEDINDLIGEIQPPAGWEIVDDLHQPVLAAEGTDTDLVKQNLKRHLPFITDRVEKYIDSICMDYDILIPESYVFLDPDGTFHILFLLNKQDYLSPKIYALKYRVHNYFETTERIDMRFSFMIDMEYIRTANVLHAYKLKYSFSKAA